MRRILETRYLPDEKACMLSAAKMLLRHAEINRSVLRYLAVTACVVTVCLILYLADVHLSGSGYIKLNIKCVDKTAARYTYTSLSNYSTNRSSVRQSCETCRKRFPGAIIAGVNKCGTGALDVFLNLHPEIAAVVNPQIQYGVYAKELKFFTLYYDKGLDWYRDQMPCSYSDQVTIEKDPGYFLSDKVPGRIKQMDEHVKIIMIVKEPVERAISMYAMLTQDDINRKSFEEMTSEPDGSVSTKSKFIRFSRYSKYVDHWFKVFNRTQIHFVNGNEFETQPANALQKIEDFLHIRPFFTNNMFYFNETKRKHCYYSYGVSNCLGANKGRKHPIISIEHRKQLMAFFKPYNEEFFRKINKRFNWGY